MNRIEVVQRLLARYEAPRYLEVGCAADECFSQVEAAHKVGVDPTRGGTLRMASDEYFALCVDTFDVVFIDGDHRHPQVFRDVSNALRHLSPKGAVVMHDCLPPNLGHEAPTYCGTVWRVFAKVRERPDLEAFTGDFDYGVGMIWKRPNTDRITIGRSMDDLTYNDFMANREAWMRPVSPERVEQLIQEDW